jgi:hypothetical protein
MDRRMITNVVFWLIAAAVYVNATAGKDPYAACAKKQTAQEREACEDQTSYALSAGW